MNSILGKVVYFAVKDARAAKKIADHLIKSPNDCLLLPFADSGPLLKEILAKKFRSLVVCERQSVLRENSKPLVEESNECNRIIKLYSDDVFDMSFQLENELAQERLSSLARMCLAPIMDEKLEKCDKSNNEEAVVKFLVPLMKSRNEVSFLKMVYYQVSLRMGLCSDSLVHFYFLLSGRQFNYFNSNPKEDFLLYRASSVVYNTLFKIRKLETFSLTKTFGVHIKSIQRTAWANRSKYKDVHLVLFEPNLDVLDELDPHSLVSYRFLVNQLMIRRSSSIVTALERWFPNVGLDLEQLGINKKAQAGDITPEQYYDLFKYVKTREDYQRSVFMQALRDTDVYNLSDGNDDLDEDFLKY